MTAGCTDEHYSELLYAYELGMLSEVERRELELHLVECDACFASLQQFRQAARLIQNDQLVQKAIRQSADEEVATAPGAAQPLPDHRRLRPRWVVLAPPLVAAAAVILILILTNWEIMIRPTPEVHAVPNRMAVMYFRNVLDERDSLRLAEIATNLVITDLAESHFLQVVSSQRLYDILRQMGHENDRIIDEAEASRIARETRASWMLTGSVLQVQPRLVLTAQLADVADGRVLASQHVEGEPGEDVFSVVDKLTRAIKRDVPLPAEAKRETDRQVADVTTHSLDAYRHYLEGMELAAKYYHREAIKNLEQALMYDSTFAMAYYALAVLKDRRMIDRAVQYAGQASWKEQRYIYSVAADYAGNQAKAIVELEQLLERYPDEKDALYALGVHRIWQGRYEQAIEYFNQTIAADPSFKLAYNWLAYAYQTVGMPDRALEAIEQYVALAPEEPNPYDSRGEILALNGRFAEAVASYQQALAIKPDYYSSLIGVGDLHLLCGEYDSAKSYILRLVNAPDSAMRSRGRLALAYIPVHQGKFAEAQRVLDDGIAADGMEEALTWDTVRKHLLKAVVFLELRDTAAALAELRTTQEVHNQFSMLEQQCHRAIYAGLTAQAGDLGNAHRIAEELRAFLQTHGITGYFHHYAVGAVGLAENDNALAVAELENSAKMTRDFHVHFMLGRAYVAVERYAEAARTFEELLRVPDAWRTFWGSWSARIPYYLAKSYEALGRAAEAAEQYERFLNLWREADTGVPEVQDARSRLQHLRS